MRMVSEELSLTWRIVEVVNLINICLRVTKSHPGIRKAAPRGTAPLRLLDTPPEISVQRRVKQ